jgi:hypothetical protein
MLVTKTRPTLWFIRWLGLALLTGSAFGQRPPGEMRETNPGPRPPAGQVLAIVGARLIDGRGGAPVDDAVVIVRESRIEAEGRVARLRFPRGRHASTPPD